MANRSLQQIMIPIVATATWIVTSFASFIAFPFRFDADTAFDPFITGLTIPLVALVCAFGVTAPKIFTAANRPRPWFVAASVSALLLVIMVSIYFHLQFSWTCVFSTAWGDFLLVIAGPKAGCEQVLIGAAGFPQSVYPADALQLRYEVLGVVYAGCWLCMATALVALTNAWLLRAPARRKKAATNA